MSRPTWGSRWPELPFRLRGCHPLWPDFPDGFGYRTSVPYAAPLPRRTCVRRFGLFRFRSPLLTESRLFSFPQGTEMFHFPWFASRTYEFSTG